MFKAIWAEDLDRAIGDGENMLWYIPEDFRRFKELTLFAPVVMGKHTWLSLPEQNRPLKDRVNYVLSTSLDRTTMPPHSVVLNRMSDITSLIYEDPVVWIIGGANLYQQTMNLVSVVERTVVHLHTGGQVKAPVLTEHGFELANKTNIMMSENNDIPFHYETWIKEN